MCDSRLYWLIFFTGLSIWAIFWLPIQDYKSLPTIYMETLEVRDNHIIAFGNAYDLLDMEQDDKNFQLLLGHHKNPIFFLSVPIATIPIKGD